MTGQFYMCEMVRMTNRIEYNFGKFSENIGKSHKLRISLKISFYGATRISEMTWQFNR